jgi:hypothetical protein
MSAFSDTLLGVCVCSECPLSALFVEMCIMQHWSRLAFMLPFTQLEIKMQGFAM